MTSELENPTKDIHNDTQTFPIIIKSEIYDSFSQINDEDVLNNRDEVSNFEIQNIVKNEPVQDIPISLNQFSHNVNIKKEKTDFSSECYLDNSSASSTLSDFMNESYDHFLNEPSAVEPEYIKPEDIKSEFGEYSNDDPSQNVCLEEPSDENNLKMRTRLKHILCCVCPFIGLGQREVAEHFNTTHIRGKFLICPICSFKTKWRKSLIRHVVRHELRDRVKGSNRSVYDSIEVNVDNSQIEGTSKEVACKNEFDITTPEFVSVENIKHEIEDLKEETCEVASENEFNCTKPEFVGVEDIKCEIEDSKPDIVDKSDVKSKSEDTDEAQDVNNSHSEIKTIKTERAKLDYDSDREVDRTVCIICHQKCKNKADIEQHYKTVHMRDGLMICTTCDFKTKWKRALVRHVVLHDKDLSYKCPYCKFNTKQKAYLKLHIKHKHEESDIYHSCEYCSFKSKHKGALWRHQKLQHSLECTRYKCAECDFETKRKDHLSTHMISKHSDAVFKCPHCDFKTKLKYDIKKHVLRKHGLAKLATE